MRTIIYIAFTILVFSSCGRNYADYDFGEFEFKDPFCGIEEEYRPEFLKKTLEYPPFSWFMEDSTYNEAFLFHVEFNEECVRDKSPVEFCITDKDGNVINCLSIECEGKVTHNGFFYVYPSALQKDVNILVDIPLAVGDTIITGYIVVNRETVDEVNEAEVTAPYQSIGSFYYAHHVSTNWLVILLWLVCLALILFLLFIILKWLLILILKAGSYLKSLLKFPKPSFSTKRSRKKAYNKQNNNNKKEKKKKQKKENDEENDRELLAWEALQKMNTLYNKLLDGIRIGDYMKLNKRIDQLPEPWRTIMNNYNCSGETKKPSERDGVWSRNSNSVDFWKPNKTLMPKGQGNDSNYNPNRWTLREFLRYTGNREYVCFKNGYPDFKPFAYMTFRCDIPLKMETDRNKLHPYIINNILPNMMGCDVEKVKQLLGDEKLTIHENVDGSFSLVHLSIHSSIPHHGGVYLCKKLCSGPCMPTVLNSRFIN